MGGELGQPPNVLVLDEVINFRDKSAMNSHGEIIMGHKYGMKIKIISRTWEIMVKLPEPREAERFKHLLLTAVILFTL